MKISIIYKLIDNLDVLPHFFEEKQDSVFPSHYHVTLLLSFFFFEQSDRLIQQLALGIEPIVGQLLVAIERRHTACMSKRINFRSLHEILKHGNAGKEWTARG